MKKQRGKSSSFRKFARVIGLHADWRDNLRRVAVPFFATLAMMVAAGSAFGQDRHWTNTTNSGNTFATGTNWAEGTAPTSTENAIFDQASNYNVVFAANAASNKLYVNGGNTTFQGNFLYQLTENGFIENGSTLNLGGTSLATGTNYNFYVGDSTTGNTLNMSLGSNLSNRSGYIGNQAGSSGTANVTGGSHWNNSTYLYVGNEGNGTLNVSNGGQVSSGSWTTIGQIMGANGSATVTDAGSVMNVGSMYVGTRADGTLDILNGGVVNSGSTYLGYLNNFGVYYAGNGVATVDGVGSQWNDTGTFYLGHRGRGQLNIQNGGVVNSENVAITYNGASGYDENGVGVVDGAGSAWNVNNDLTFGGGNGSLTIQNDGLTAVAGTTTVSSNGTIYVNTGSLDINTGSTITGGLSTGVLTMSGGLTNVAGSTVLDATGTLNLNGGELRTQNFTSNAGGIFSHDGGTLSINGGTLDLGSITSLTLDSTGGTTGLNLMNGSSYSLSNTLNVGDTGNASLGVQNGASISSYVLYAGNQAGSNGTVVVDGAGSTLDSTGYLYVGYAGDGTMTVSNGGVFNGTYYDYVGYTGTGELNILSGGKFNSGSGYGLFIARNSGSVATVNIDGVGSELNSDWFQSVNGNGTTNITNQGLANISGDTRLYANGTLNVSTGELNVDSTHTATAGMNTNMLSTYGGTVNVDGVTRVGANGTLLINGGTLSTGSFNHTSGGSFDFRSGSMVVNNGVFDPGTTSYTLDSTYAGVTLNIDSGGSANFADGFTIGSNGTLDLAGVFDSGDLTNTSGGTVNVNGGISTVNGDFDNSGSVFSFNAGTVNIENGSFNSGVASFNLDSVSGTSTLNLNGGSTMDYQDTLTVGANGRLNVETGDIDVSDGMNASTGFSSGTLMIAGGRVNADGNLRVGHNGTGLVQLDGGSLSVTGQFSLDAAGTVNLNAGTLQFGSTSFDEFKAINKSVGSEIIGQVDVLAGQVVDVNEMDNLSGSLNSLTNQIVWNNGGTILGDGSVQGSLLNATDAELRVAAGNRIRFSTFDASHSNFGRIDVVGTSSSTSEIEFEGNLVNETDGLFTARNALIRFDRGMQNDGQFSVALGDADVYGNINNDGTIGIGGNSNLSLLGDLHQFGDLNILSGSKLIVFDDYFGYGYNGTGELEILGTLDVGSSPGVAEFGGDVTLGSETLIELGGMQLGDYDKLIVRGDLTLNGQLDVAMWDGFELTGNDEFLIAEIDGQQIGDFWGLNEGDVVGNFNGLDLMISYKAGDGNDVSLFTAVPEPTSNAICMAVLLVACLAGRRVRKRLEIAGKV